MPPPTGERPVYYNNDFGIARYLPNGTLDPSFGPNGNGKVNINVSTYTTSDGNNQADEARAVAIQPDGKIIVGGRTLTAGGDASLVRLDASGNLDPSFGQGGRVVTPVGSEATSSGKSRSSPTGRSLSPATRRTRAISPRSSSPVTTRQGVRTRPRIERYRDHHRILRDFRSREGHGARVRWEHLRHGGQPHHRWGERERSHPGEVHPLGCAGYHVRGVRLRVRGPRRQ